MNTDLNQFKDDLSWEEKAKINPLFAVMSDQIFKDSGTEFKQEELDFFYHQGEKFWNRWFRQLLWDKSVADNISILEYGCGMGRILNQPAQENMKCSGVDISTTQLDLAKKFCPNAGKIEFILLDKEGLIPREMESFDIVYSYAVLQHIKQSSALRLAVSEICRMVKKNGLVKLQVRAQQEYLSKGVYKTYRSINLENVSLCFYLRKFGVIYLPVIRLRKHTNWKGACGYYSIGNILKLFKKSGVEIDQIELDTKNKVVWLTGTKN